MPSLSSALFRRTPWLWLACLLLLSPLGALPFKEVIKKKELEVTVHYTLTGMLPIVINRSYPGGRSEQLILRPLTSRDARALYELVRHSQAHLKPFMARILEKYGTSVAATEASIAADAYANHLQQALRLGIFFKASPEAPERLVGQVGVHSFGYYAQGSVDAVYWVGDAAYIKAEGIARMAITALFNHLVAVGLAQHLNIVTDRHNRRSRRIAQKLGMQRIDPKRYSKWHYGNKRDEVCAYSLSAPQWQAAHFPSQQV